MCPTNYRVLPSFEITDCRIFFKNLKVFSSEENIFASKNRKKLYSWSLKEYQRNWFMQPSTLDSSHLCNNLSTDTQVCGLIILYFFFMNSFKLHYYINSGQKALN